MLCRIAHRLSEVVAYQMELPRLSGGALNYSEEGVSYTLLRELFGLPGVTVAEFNKQEELSNGADLEVGFTDGHRLVRWRIQAKRTNDYGEFEHLRYVVHLSPTKAPPGAKPIGTRPDGKVAYLQCEILISRAAIDRVVPMYWLYSPPHVSGGATCQCLHVQSAHMMLELIERPPTTSAGRPRIDWGHLAGSIPSTLRSPSSSLCWHLCSLGDSPLEHSQLAQVLERLASPFDAFQGRDSDDSLTPGDQQGLITDLETAPEYVQAVRRWSDLSAGAQADQTATIDQLSSTYEDAPRRFVLLRLDALLGQRAAVVR